MLNRLFWLQRKTLNSASVRMLLTTKTSFYKKISVQPYTMKVLIDCDPGIDDAIALGIALASKKDVDIVGITCVNGNVEVSKTVKNTCRILEAYDRIDVPVFSGAQSAIIKHNLNGSNFHGTDGLADVFTDEPNTSLVQKEHAVSAITRLAKEHKNELTIIAIGPLTNLALALRMDPNLATNVKELIVMGGNYQGVGNVTIAAEFNFYMDHVAAHIALEEFKCPIYLITWELSMRTFLTCQDIAKYCSKDNKRSNLQKAILANKNLIDEHESGFCDAVAVAVALYRDMITKHHKVYGTVELEGQHTKGMVLIDWNPQYRVIGDTKEPNLIVVDQIDEEMYRKVFLESTDS